MHSPLTCRNHCHHCQSNRLRREMEQFSRSMVSCSSSSSTSPAPVWQTGSNRRRRVFVSRAGKLSVSANEQEIHWGYKLRYWMLPSIYFSAAYRVLLSLVVVFVLASRRFGTFSRRVATSERYLFSAIVLLLVRDVFCQLSLVLIDYRL